MGVNGNDRTDRLVGSATISRGQSIDRADILNALKECGQREEYHPNQSTSTSRLQGPGLKIGVAIK
uniref:Uncharacterized protein n=1 Tax=Arion vulgaris TaxID=1028688 RepID=A0A0B7A8P4_9EUPU